MDKVTSKDGTIIAYDKAGQGEPLILVGGAFNTRDFGPNPDLAKLLAQHFTVYNYDRRGRGDSTDTLPYAVEREVEDLEALTNQIGGPVHLYGISSGAGLALEAARRGLPVKKLALYEAPFIVDNTRPAISDDYLAKLKQFIAADRRGDAIKLFFTKGVNLPGFVVTMMRFMPAWAKLKAIAPTVVYDATIVIDYEKGQPYPAGQWANVTVPALVVSGGKSPAWMQNAMKALGAALPNGTHRTLEGQTHIVKVAALAPVLEEFFR